MGLLINGEWSADWYKTDPRGRFVRPETQFRKQVTADGASGFKAESGRYHLYVSLACPWAHRTLIMRKLKGLEAAVSVSIVDPIMGADGWRFSNGPGCVPDSINETEFLRDVYLKAQADYTGRVTVPVLWDRRTATIVNNESLEIMRMLDTQFNAVGDDSVDFYPPALQQRIDATIERIYAPINNGVYRAGFAIAQSAYEAAVTELFDALDDCEGVLANQRFLCGDVITEADWCLFTTLVRFDAVYVGHFKCNLRRLVDYPHLWCYVKELYQLPGVAKTCNFDHIKRHYYESHTMINPTGIVPKGPIIDFNETHDRDRLG